MKEGLTEVAFVLDRSGSMHELTNETIGGFNSFVERQRAEAGECRLTTVLFDTEYDVLHDGVDLTEVAPLTQEVYYARGATALLDAVGRTINALGSRLGATPEEERPEQVIFVVTTDGLENSSREFRYEQIREMVRHQERVYNWRFLFLGANIDSFTEGENLGFNPQTTANYDPTSEGTEALYDSVSNYVADRRARKPVAEDAAMSTYMESAVREVRKRRRERGAKS